jgi:hypothetical protein
VRRWSTCYEEQSFKQLFNVDEVGCDLEPAVDMKNESIAIGWTARLEHHREEPEPDAPADPWSVQARACTPENG